MTSLVEFSLDGDESILVEVSESIKDRNRDGLVAVPGQQTIVKAQKSFSEAIEKVKPTVSKIIGAVRDMKDSPSEIEVKFGVKMTAAAGAVIALASVESNYEITLKWKDRTD